MTDTTIVCDDDALLDMLLGSVVPMPPASTTHDDGGARALLDSLLDSIPVDLPLLDIPDVRDAMQHLDKTRTQPRFTVDGKYDAGGVCRYSDPTTGRPSCIIGHMIAYLAPIYFAWIAQQDGGVPDAERVFTPRALDLLRSMQYHADAGRTWGDAYLEASLDRLVAVAE